MGHGDLLGALSRRGIALGLRERQQYARLLASWQGSGEQLRVAVAALLGKSPAEASTVREVFDQYWGPLPAAPLAAAPPRPWRRLVLIAVMVVLVIAGAATAIRMRGRKPPPPPAPAAQEPTKAPSPPVTPPVLAQPDEPACTADDLPRPIRRPLLARPIGFSVAGGALAALLGYLARLRMERRARRRRYWRDRLDQLPGPDQYEPVTTGLRPALLQEDLEDVATLLVRLKVRGRDLDVLRTVERTLNAGGVPDLVYRQRGAPRTIAVLVDTHPTMAPWRQKVDDLLSGLSRLGVHMTCWYFDADPSRLSATPTGPRISLSELGRREPDAPLLLISTGDGLCSNGQMPRWMRLLCERFATRAWLHPASHPSLFSALLRQLYEDPGNIRVWPLSRSGLLGAAACLAQDDSRPLPERGRAVSEEDLARMKGLVALVPYSSLELTKLLRQRYAPDIPEDVILHLLACGTDPFGTVLHWPAEELTRSLALWRIRNGADEEERVRRGLLQVLDDSEPSAGSAAHLRWRLDRAMQQIYLRDSASRAAALDELRALLDSPIWREAQSAIHRLGVGAGSRDEPWLPLLTPLGAQASRVLAGKVRQSGPGPVRRGGVPSASGVSEGRGPVLPGHQESLLCTLVAGLVLLAFIVGSRGWPQQQLDHIIGYVLRQEGTVLIIDRVANSPVRVTLYRGAQAGGELSLRGAQTRLPLPEQPGCYFVRAAMPQGNFAISNQLPVRAPKVPPPAPSPAVVEQGRIMITFASAVTGASLGRLPYQLEREIGPVMAGHSGESLDVPAGQWTLTASIPHLGAVSRRVQIRPGELMRERIEVGEAALLEITGLPEGVDAEAVRVNGAGLRGRTARVAAGRVQVRLEHPLYDYAQVLQLRAGERRQLSIAATPCCGELLLQIAAPAATLEGLGEAVHVVRRTAGAKEVTFYLQGRAGQYSATVHASGYVDQLLAFTVESGKTRQQTVTLMRTAELEPIVTVLWPPQESPFSTEEVSVRVRLRSQSGLPITTVEMLWDGGPPVITRPQGLKEGEISMVARLPGRDVQLQIIARTESASSKPIVIQLRYRGPLREDPAPNLYLLAVGVSRYRDERLRGGEFASKDASDLVAVLSHRKPYRTTEIRRLIDAEATRARMLDGLAWLGQRASRNDVSIVYFSGHTAIDPTSHMYCLLPSDAILALGQKTGICIPELSAALRQISGKSLLFLDAESIPNDLRFDAADRTILFNASSIGQPPLEWRRWGHSAFTKALIEGLSGKAARMMDNGKVTVSLLEYYVSQRVRELTKGAQTPTSTKPSAMTDFVIVNN